MAASASCSSANRRVECSCRTLPGLGQAHAARHALEQLHAQACLEGFQFAREGRLRDVQLARGCTDAAALGNRVKHGEMM